MSRSWLTVFTILVVCAVVSFVLGQEVPIPPPPGVRLDATPAPPSVDAIEAITKDSLQELDDVINEMAEAKRDLEAERRVNEEIQGLLRELFATPALRPPPPEIERDRGLVVEADMCLAPVGPAWSTAPDDWWEPQAGSL